MLSTAIKFMWYDRAKSIGIIVGIVISIFLIGQQLSTLGFLSELMGNIVENSNPQYADIWVLTSDSKNANSLTGLDAALVNQIKSVEGVEATYPMIVGKAQINFGKGKYSSVTLIGSSIPELAAGPMPRDIIKGNFSDLYRNGAVSADIVDDRTFKYPIKVGTQVEINGKWAYIAVLAKNTRSFGYSTLYTNMDNARNYLSTNEISAILVKVKNKANIANICKTINQSFVGVHAWERQKLKDTTISTILKESNMGLSFGSLVVFAVISGFFIIGLTLYTSTFDRVKDYGTLKAIGANNFYISRLVVLQSFLYAIIGYSIAISLLFGMKFGVAKAGLILVITPSLIIELFLMTLFISVGGSFFAVSKLRKLEPASVFR